MASAPLDFSEKAHENLEACNRLFRELRSAAASRAYYAAYLALAHVAQRDGMDFTGKGKDGAPYYRHDTFPDDAFEWGLLSEEQQAQLSWLEGLRIKADYDEAPVEEEEADMAGKLARSLVMGLLA